MLSGMPERNFTPHDFARILSRAFSIYLLVWALSDLLTLPELVPSFIHYLHFPPAYSQRNYWLTYYVTRIIIDSLRSVAMLIGSRYLWKNGTYLLTFFAKEEKDSSVTTATEL